MKIDANVIQFNKAKDAALKLKAEKTKKDATSKENTSLKETAPYANEIRQLPQETKNRISQVGEANALISEIRQEMKFAPESIKNVHRDLNPEHVIALLK